jgi:hypothetical protein
MYFPKYQYILVLYFLNEKYLSSYLKALKLYTFQMNVMYFISEQDFVIMIYRFLILAKIGRVLGTKLNVEQKS